MDLRTGERPVVRGFGIGAKRGAGEGQGRVRGSEGGDD